MRSTSALYRFACEEENCVSHTDLVKLFHGVDVALQANVPALPCEANALADAEDSDGDDAALTPPPPALTDPLLVAFRPDLRYPTHITLSATHLGDAGTAAFFRVLPMLRWLRVVEARDVGAGARSMTALRRGLMDYLVDGCEEAPPALPETDGSSADVHPLAGRLPALEKVDLRDNDAIFSCAVEELLVVLRQRRAALLRWCVKHGEASPETSLLPALAVYVSAENLLPCTAGALQDWNDAAAAVWLRRTSAAAERQWQEQLKVFTKQVDDSAAAVQPVGEHVVFRLPLTAQDTREGRLRSPEDAVRAALNAHMPQFLSAACMLAPCTTNAKDARLYAAAEGAYAALQASVDFGADALAILATSNAALWRAARVSHSTASEEKGQAASPPPLLGEVRLLELQCNVRTLLHALEAEPKLEEELVASAVAGGVVVERHLRRLRELAAALENAGSTAFPIQSDFEEMVQLYNRVVAAVVTQRFSADHLPSLAAYEHHVSEVVDYVVQHLVVGESDAATLSAMVSRLQNSVQPNLPSFPRREKGKLVDADADGEQTRALPPVMAACHYYLQRHPEEERAWVQVYGGTSAVVAAAARQSCATSTELPAAMHAFHRCHCTVAAEPDTLTAATASTRRCLEPCTTCAYRALRSVQDALEHSTSGTQWRARWEMQAGVRHALPRPLRMCLLDMVVRQRSRAQGGCAFVPPLYLPASEREGERWSMAAWLAGAEQQEAHWEAVLRVFGQWYRLRVFESVGTPEALALVQLTC